MRKNDFDIARKQLLEEKAESGNVTAIQTLMKLEREERLNDAKEEIFGEAVFDKPENEEKNAVRELKVMPNYRHISDRVDELDISEIEKYIEHGDFKSLPEHMAVYLDWMQEAHDWYYKFKSRTWVMRYLMANCKDKDGNFITYYLADKIFNDMLVFFYADKNFKRNSWYRYLAERIEMLARLAVEDNDFETAGKNMERAAKVMSMITVDKQDIDPRLLDRRPRFFITKTSELGLPDIDRYKLARQIDGLEVSEKEKIKAKMDLGVEDRDFLEANVFTEEEEEESADES